MTTKRHRNLFGHYVLDDHHRVIGEPDMLRWAKWMEANEKLRIVGRETFMNVKPWLARDLKAWVGDKERTKWYGKKTCDASARVILVSTVFLGLDHSFGAYGPPIVFETMVFNGPHDGEQHRYASWDDAEAGHKATAGRVTAALALMRAQSEKENTSK